MNKKNKDFLKEFECWQDYIYDKVDPVFKKEVKPSIETMLQKITEILENNKHIETLEEKRIRYKKELEDEMEKGL